MSFVQFLLTCMQGRINFTGGPWATELYEDPIPKWLTHYILPIKTQYKVIYGSVQFISTIVCTNVCTINYVHFTFANEPTYTQMQTNQL